MNNLLSPQALGGSFALQTARPLEWLFVAAALGIFGAGAVLFYWRGGRDKAGSRRIPDRLAAGLEALSGLPAWSAAGVLIGLWALIVAYVGFVWDVAWHADTGRDPELFTVPHTLIIMGLGGMALAALAAVALATLRRAESGWRWRRFRVPYSALPLFLLGMGALTGFPLDDLWHAAYGIDVTMWSPTHQLMIGGASLSPLAIWLMLTEAGARRGGPGGRLWLALPGAVLIGLSTFQLEYDMGIPQWQALFQPVLIAAAAAIGLVAARAALGRGGALVAVVGFMVLRILVALLVGPGLHHTLPRFPLYLGEAAVVEIAFAVLGSARPIWRALVAGALVGTVGVATEWAWTHLWFTNAWQPSLLPYLWIAVAAAIAGSVVGLAAGQVLAGRRPEVPFPMVAGALVVLAFLVAFHLPARQAGPGRVTIETAAAGPASLVTNRDGTPTVRRDVTLALTVEPPDAVLDADWFNVTAWQGGPPVQHLRLVQTSPGHYRAEGVVPTGGNWKSLIMLGRGDVVAAVPVAMPADPAYGLGEIPPPDQRTAAFSPASSYLMREFRGGSPWPAYVATGAFIVIVLAWVAGLGLAFRAAGRLFEPGPAALRRSRRKRTRPRVT